MSTFRAYKGSDRIATARVTKTGSAYQVYPTKAEFDSVDAWKAAWTTADSFDESVPRKTKPHLKPSIATRRREREFSEFLDPDYKWLVTSASRINIDTLGLSLNDGSKVKVMRSDDYLRPPRIWRNDVEYLSGQYGDSYSPAITSVRWLMMLMFCKSDIDSKDV